MTKLVFIENNRPVTDSLTVAEVFGKEHKNVLRDIEMLDCSEEFSRLNFEQSTYINERGREYPKVNMTQDGFTFLVMGYTGKEAARFKEMYIGEFNRMRDHIIASVNQPSYMIDDPIKRAEKWINEERDRQALLALNKQREEQLALAAPKLALYDTAMNAGNNFTMERVSKTLGYGRNKLFEFLREIKVLRGNNLPYQEYIDRGYFAVRQYSVTHYTTGIENKTQTLVTPRGMAFIHESLVKHGKVTA
jgi:Rha family phage regulatory protein